MKSLVLIISLFSLSSFATNIDSSALEANIEEISFSLDSTASCSEVYDQITDAYTNLGKIMGMVELILEMDPNADVSEAQKVIAVFQSELKGIDAQFKGACL